MEELALEEVEFRGGYPTDFGVEGVCAEGVAEALTGDDDGGDDETVARQRGEGEEGLPGADLVDVVEDEEEDGFLRTAQGMFQERERRAIGSHKPRPW